MGHEKLSWYILVGPTVAAAGPGGFSFSFSTYQDLNLL